MFIRKKAAKPASSGSTLDGQKKQQSVSGGNGASSRKKQKCSQAPHGGANWERGSGGPDWTQGAAPYGEMPNRWDFPQGGGNPHIDQRSMPFNSQGQAPYGDIQGRWGSFDQGPSGGGTPYRDNYRGNDDYGPSTWNAPPPPFAYSQGGGAFPQGGGAFPQGGGAFPQGGGAFPQGGGAFPQGGGAFPQGGRDFPQGGRDFPQGGRDVLQGGRNLPQKQLEKKVTVKPSLGLKNENKQGSQKNENKQGSQKNKNIQGSRKNKNIQGSQKNINKQGSQKNINKQGSQKNINKQGSQRDKNNQGSQNNKKGSTKRWKLQRELRFLAKQAATLNPPVTQGIVQKGTNEPRFRMDNCDSDIQDSYWQIIHDERKGNGNDSTLEKFYKENNVRSSSEMNTIPRSFNSMRAAFKKAHVDKAVFCCNVCRIPTFENSISFFDHFNSELHSTTASSYFLKNELTTKYLMMEAQWAFARNIGPWNPNSPKDVLCQLCDVPKTHGDINHLSLKECRILHQFENPIACCLGHGSVFSSRASYDWHCTHVIHLQKEYHCKRSYIWAEDADVRDMKALKEEVAKEIQSQGIFETNFRQLKAAKEAKVYKDFGTTDLPEEVQSLLSFYKKDQRSTYLKDSLFCPQLNQFKYFEPSSSNGKYHVVFDTDFECTLCGTLLERSKQSIVDHCSTKEHYDNVMMENARACEVEGCWTRLTLSLGHNSCPHHVLCLISVTYDPFNCIPCLTVIGDLQSSGTAEIFKRKRERLLSFIANLDKAVSRHWQRPLELSEFGKLVLKGSFDQLKELNVTDAKWEDSHCRLMEGDSSEIGPSDSALLLAERMRVDVATRSARQLNTIEVTAEVHNEKNLGFSSGEGAVVPKSGPIPAAGRVMASSILPSEHRVFSDIFPGDKSRSDRDVPPAGLGYQQELRDVGVGEGDSGEIVPPTDSIDSGYSGLPHGYVGAGASRVDKGGGSDVAGTSPVLGGSGNSLIIDGEQMLTSHLSGGGEFSQKAVAEGGPGSVPLSHPSGDGQGFVSNFASCPVGEGQGNLPSNLSLPHPVGSCLVSVSEQHIDDSSRVLSPRVLESSVRGSDLSGRPHVTKGSQGEGSVSSLAGGVLSQAVSTSGKGKLLGNQVLDEQLRLLDSNDNRTGVINSLVESVGDGVGSGSGPNSVSFSDKQGRFLPSNCGPSDSDGSASAMLDPFSSWVPLADPWVPSSEEGRVVGVWNRCTDEVLGACFLQFKKNGPHWLFRSKSTVQLFDALGRRTEAPDVRLLKGFFASYFQRFAYVPHDLRVNWSAKSLPAFAVKEVQVSEGLPYSITDLCKVFEWFSHTKDISFPSTSLPIVGIMDAGGWTEIALCLLVPKFLPSVVATNFGVDAKEVVEAPADLLEEEYHSRQMLLAVTSNYVMKHAAVDVLSINEEPIYFVKAVTGLLKGSMTYDCIMLDDAFSRFFKARLALRHYVLNPMGSEARKLLASCSPFSIDLFDKETVDAVCISLSKMNKSIRGVLRGPGRSKRKKESSSAAGRKKRFQPRHSRGRGGQRYPSTSGNQSRHSFSKSSRASR